MWGIWASDPRGQDPRGEPFEIPMQGMGAFSCLKQAWLGFHDDMLPEDTDGPEACKFLPRLRESCRTDNWKRCLFGGEMVFNGNQRWLGVDFAHMQKMVDEAHFSWVGPYCPALEPNPNSQFSARAAQLVRRMGYQFSLTEIRHSAEVGKDSQLTVAIEGDNQGVAPFYYPWAVEFAMLEEVGKPIERLPVRWDIRKWLPGHFSEKATLQPAAKPGSYQLAIGIIDPWTNRPAIALANDLPRQDNWTVLSKVRVSAK